MHFEMRKERLSHALLGGFRCPTAGLPAHDCACIFGANFIESQVTLSSRARANPS